MSETEKDSTRLRLLRRALAGIFLLLVAPVLLILGFSYVDYSRVEHGRRPIFSISSSMPDPDGGTVRWFGLGYRLSAMHRLASAGQHRGYTVGPVLEYWFPVWPFRNRSHAWFQSVDRERGAAPDEPVR